VLPLTPLCDLSRPAEKKLYQALVARPQFFAVNGRSFFNRHKGVLIAWVIDGKDYLPVVFHA
jgi:hypothetical protein